MASSIHPIAAQPLAGGGVPGPSRRLGVRCATAASTCSGQWGPQHAQSESFGGVQGRLSPGCLAGSLVLRQALLFLLPAAPAPPLVPGRLPHVPGRAVPHIHPGPRWRPPLPFPQVALCNSASRPLLHVRGWQPPRGRPPRGGRLARWRGPRRLPGGGRHPRAPAGLPHRPGRHRRRPSRRRAAGGAGHLAARWGDPGPNLARVPAAIGSRPLWRRQRHGRRAVGHLCLGPALCEHLWQPAAHAERRQPAAAGHTGHPRSIHVQARVHRQLSNQASPVPCCLPSRAGALQPQRLQHLQKAAAHSANSRELSLSDDRAACPFPCCPQDRGEDQCRWSPPAPLALEGARHKGPN